MQSRGCSTEEGAIDRGQRVAGPSPCMGSRQEQRAQAAGNRPYVRRKRNFGLSETAGVGLVEVARPCW
ncbi:hypothetical protein GOP47_0022625 [Adiantum capillus-veneris]|uniref:Uncharacterized protein n=1 Tax=Adiantum capillus-veneris TaxID=13818 RepID=A0A9D4U837_ADICA|nr:hypothetical protein GOP47_0022625 [Adiantum capillus-veneris]